MIEQINNELLKLQDELSKFDGAVAKITKAGQISDSLIESSKKLQKYFSENLEKIHFLFSDYMNKTYRHTEEKINKIFEHFQNRIKHEEMALEKYTQLTDQNTSVAQEFIQKTAEQNNEAINRLIDEAQKNLNEERDFVKLQIQSFQTKINEIINSHKERVKSEQALLDNYLELAGSTAELSKFLKSVNFPTKLNELKGQLDNISEKQNQNSLKIDEQGTEIVQKIDENNKEITKKFEQTKEVSKTMEANIKKILDDTTDYEILEKVVQIIKDNKQEEILKNNAKIISKVGSTRFFVILIFILSLIFYGFFTFAFMTFFPHFLADLF